MKTTLFTLTIVVLITGCVSSGNTHKSYNRKPNYELMNTAKLETLVQEGNLDAGHALASKYGFGLFGHERKPERGLELLKNGAEAGHPESMYSYGILHITGKLGVKKNFKLASHWLEQAAEAGNTKAMVRISHLYLSSDTGLLNPNKAFKWGKQAAESNHLLATTLLAEMYLKGWGTPQNYYQAAKWYYIWQVGLKEGSEPMPRIRDALETIQQRIGESAMKKAENEAREYRANNEMNFGE